MAYAVPIPVWMSISPTYSHKVHPRSHARGYARPHRREVLLPAA